MSVTVGLLHPGSMGSVLGGLLRANGSRVRWAAAGRSARTAARAADAGLDDLGTVEAVVAASAVIVSICPPEAAEAVARQVMDAGFTGRYLDANAISPRQARAIGDLVETRGGSFVDGAVIGPPPRAPGSTRLYLAGGSADAVATLFAGSACDVRVLDQPVGQASALKMAYAAFTKGRSALEAACLALAGHHGLLAELRAEWNLMTPGRADAVAHNLAQAAPKAWRFGGEMRFIADTFADAGLPDGFHLAAADIWQRWSHYRGGDGEESPIEAMLAELPRPPAPEGTTT